jgi:hypothetical protein
MKINGERVMMVVVLVVVVPPRSGTSLVRHFRM